MGQLKIVKASAGSGKTFMLAYEYIKNVITLPHRYRNILAVTFTNKATEEMKTRILDDLYKLSKGESDYMPMLKNDLDLDTSVVQNRAEEALSLILHDYSNFSVMTIDGFFQKVVRAFTKELHLECDYSIDFNTDYLLTLSTDLLIREAQEDSVLQEWINGFIEDRIDQSKRFDLRSDMVTLSRRVLNDEFNKSYFNSHRNELIAFFEQIKIQNGEFTTNLKATAAKFLTIVSDNGLTEDDFSYKKAGFIGYVKKVANGAFEDYGKRVEDALSPNSNWNSGKSTRTDSCKTELYPLLIDICSRWNVYRTTYYTAIALLSTHRTFVLLGDISRLLDQVCSDNNKMLLDSTNYLINQLVSGNDAPFIYEKMGCRYDTIMIDEFQDTSSKQWENFVPLIENSLALSDNDTEAVTIVGDVKQSIYRWRGGDWQILGRKIKEIFSKSAIKEHTLDTNYRSLRTIIDFNNAVMSRSVELLNFELNSTISSLLETDSISPDFAYHNRDMLSDAYRDVSQRVPEKKGDGGYAEVLFYDDKEAKDFNLSRSVELIIELQERGYAANEITILARTNRQAAQMVDYILKYKEQNPDICNRYCLDIVSNKGLLIGRAAVVKFIIAVYQLSVNEEIINRAIYNKYLGNSLNAGLSDNEASFLRSLSYVSLYESFESIIARYNLHLQTDNIAYIQAFHNQLLSFTGKNDSSVTAFLAWWQSEGAKRSITLPDGQNAVNIVTAHSSKGLQYRVVIMPFCNWSTRPFPGDFFWAENNNSAMSLPASDNAYALVPYNKTLATSHFSQFYLRETILTAVESFNIFYVALTRAEDELYLLLPHKASSDKINDYVSAALNQMKEDEFDFTEEQHPDAHYYSWATGRKAECVTPKPRKIKGEELKVDSFNSLDYHERIKLHLESDKYYRNIEPEVQGELNFSDEVETSPLDPRGRGILLHKVFEQISDLSEVQERINTMQRNGYLTQSESISLQQIIREALGDTVICSWFESGWEVRNENSIVLPHSLSKGKFITLRPDRVICKGSQAVVIDYKFGAPHTAHGRQISTYKQLLNQMGYSDVKGYIWYISEGQVKEI